MLEPYRCYFYLCSFYFTSSLYCMLLIRNYNNTNADNEVPVNEINTSKLNRVEHTMLFREDFLLPLESLASLYHWIEEGHLKQE